MDKFGTSSIAMICGKVSGNLEVVDIDSKYKAGCAAVLFADLNKLFPDLYQKLRIHKTPSGGYHILYRVEGDQVPPNQKLAGYKKDGKTINFLETRGEGGYILAPPSAGYVTQREIPVPIITWDERCCIIELCRSYTELIKVEKPLKVNKATSDFYSENPWEHFANSDEAAHVLINNGWGVQGENSTYVYFTRPDKNKGISASFHKEHRIYYIFTSSTDFEPSKGYYPGSALSILEHQGNNKETFRRLINDGYGKIKESAERRIVENAARRGHDLPANISEEGRQKYTGLKTDLEKMHPYGTFWKYKGEGKVHVKSS